MMNPVMSPFLSWGSGRFHPKEIESDVTDTKETIIGEPLGTAREKKMEYMIATYIQWNVS